MACVSVYAVCTPHTVLLHRRYWVPSSVLAKRCYECSQSLLSFKQVLMLREVDYYDILPATERCGKQHAIGHRTIVCLQTLDALEARKQEQILKEARSKQQCPPAEALELARRLVTEQVSPAVQPAEFSHRLGAHQSLSPNFDNV